MLSPFNFKVMNSLSHYVLKRYGTSTMFVYFYNCSHILRCQCVFQGFRQFFLFFFIFFCSLKTVLRVVVVLTANKTIGIGL